jgi:hypothetical protein
MTLTRLQLRAVRPCTSVRALTAIVRVGRRVDRTDGVHTHLGSAIFQTQQTLAPTTTSTAAAITTSPTGVDAAAPRYAHVAFPYTKLVNPKATMSISAKDDNYVKCSRLCEESVCAEMRRVHGVGVFHRRLASARN